MRNVTPDQYPLNTFKDSLNFPYINTAYSKETGYGPHK